MLVLCLTSCCSVLLQDPNRVFPIGSGLDGLYSSLSPVVDFVPSCSLALLVFQFHHPRSLLHSGVRFQSWPGSLFICCLQFLPSP
jgi:hypothetical protein